MTLETIAFIGLGNMGLPMARNLIGAGHRVIGFDLAAAATQAAAAQGVALAASAAEAASGAEVVITMLPAGAHVLGAWKEVAPVMRPGALLIDSSTIDVDAACQAHRLGAGHGLLTLDAPVSGGTGGAAAGTLTFMVGGTGAAFAAGAKLLEKMGRRLVHCGGAGTGQAAKICNNMILGISMAGVAEAFALAEHLGLSHQSLFDVAANASGQCWSLTTNCPVPGPVPASPANHGYKPGFAMALMLKDLRLSQQAALATGASSPMGARATALYERFVESGHGLEDFSAIIKMFRGLDGG